MRAREVLSIRLRVWTDPAGPQEFAIDTAYRPAQDLEKHTERCMARFLRRLGDFADPETTYWDVVGHETLQNVEAELAFEATYQRDFFDNKDAKLPNGEQEGQVVLEMVKHGVVLNLRNNGGARKKAKQRQADPHKVHSAFNMGVMFGLRKSLSEAIGFWLPVSPSCLHCRLER